MGKNLKGKELGKGITQRKNGVYHGRYVDRFGDRRSVYGTTVKEVKAKLAEAELNEQKLSSKGQKHGSLCSFSRIRKIPAIALFPQ